VLKTIVIVFARWSLVLLYATLNFYLRFAFIILSVHNTFQVFNANFIKVLCVLKFCVLNINVYLQFAGTVILNICAQLVRRAWLYYANQMAKTNLQQQIWWSINLQIFVWGQWRKKRFYSEGHVKTEGRKCGAETGCPPPCWGRVQPRRHQSEIVGGAHPGLVSPTRRPSIDAVVHHFAGFTPPWSSPLRRLRGSAAGGARPETLTWNKPNNNFYA